jgi:cell division protein FtsA
MKKGLMGEYVTAIDIGTTKICALIGYLDTDGKFDIIGIGKSPSHGLRKGIVVDIEQTVNSISTALKEVEAISGIKIDNATVGISGSHIQSFNSTGIIGIKGSEVSKSDIYRVIESAKAIQLPQNQEIIHVLPQYFRIDGQEKIFNALGMHGVRLEAQVHIITASTSSAKNIIKSCELAGIRVNDIVLEQIASAQSVLTETEKTMGVGIMDIGGGTSDFAIYKNGQILHSKVIPIAGNHFTNDSAICLRIPFKAAEELKKEIGCNINEENNTSINVDLEYEGGTKTIESSMLAELLHCRATELLSMLNQEIQNHQLHSLMPAGLVLTGGGSMIKGISKLAHSQLNIPTRIGYPTSQKLPTTFPKIPDNLKNPIYATAYGLLLYELQNKKSIFSKIYHGNIFEKVTEKMKSWLWDLF